MRRWLAIVVRPLAEIRANSIDIVRPGRIVLPHVGAQSAACEVLPVMLDLLATQAFALVTAEQMQQP